jgi:hypothetical protein
MSEMLCYNIAYSRVLSFLVSAVAVLYFPTKPNHQWNTVLKLKKHARTVLDADDDTIVCISERACSDTVRGARTIVLVIHRTRPAEAVGIDKLLEQITLVDLSEALAPLAGQTGLPQPLSKTEMTSPAAAH